MPYQEMSRVNEPDNWSDDIWRYMSYMQFISMLQNDGLPFCQAKQLQDSFEGTPPQKDLPDDFEEQNLDYPKGIKIFDREGRRDPAINYAEINLRTSIEIWKRIMYLNCWTIRENESIGMWKSYCGECGGVVIKSTAEKLRASFDSTDRAVRIGKVLYKDYKKDNVGRDNLRLFNYKRKGFEYEKELRVSVSHVSTEEDLKDLPTDELVEIDWQSQDESINVKNDLDTLIDEVRISPDCKKWKKKAIENLIDESEYDFPVDYSELAIDPSHKK